MGGPKNKGYKRSWRNLLLNKQYQLSFTLMMVGVAAMLMAGLGYWVNREAKSATEVSLTRLSDCKIDPNAGVDGAGDTEPERPRAKVEVEMGGMTMGSELPDELKPDGDEPDGDKPDGDSDKKPDGDAKPDMDGTPPDGDVAPLDGTPTDGTPTGAESAPTIEDDPVDDEESSDDAAGMAARLDRASWPVDQDCLAQEEAKRQELYDGQRFILYVLFGMGFLLMLGLSAYGIKMTHKVAGPLFKVGLYFKKMRDGKFDTVWNLRKGDQLVDFYNHFKQAHAGVKEMQVEDVERFKAMIDAAEKADLATKSPELASLLDEMREVVTRKEKGLE